MSERIRTYKGVSYTVAPFEGITSKWYGSAWASNKAGQNLTGPFRWFKAMAWCDAFKLARRIARSAPQGAA